MDEIKNLITAIKTNTCSTQHCISEKTKLNEALREYNKKNNREHQDEANLNNSNIVYDSNYYVDTNYNLCHFGEYIETKRRI